MTQFVLKYPVKFRNERNCVNVSGDYLYRSKNVHDSFMISYCENSRYCQFLQASPGSKDCYDYTIWGEAGELIYETYAAGINPYNLKFCLFMYPDVRDCEYSLMCPSSKNLFGCVGLKRKQYCILNKQYSKDSFNTLRTRIRKHMEEMPYRDERGIVYKYGEAFPPQFSPFAYNDTIAQDYFPLSKEEALKRGYRWRDSIEKTMKMTMKHDDLPNHSREVSDFLCNEIIGCEHEAKCIDQCTKGFRIIPQELKFYKKMGIPLPHLCFPCRQAKRLTQRNPLKLLLRKCQCAGIKSDPSTGSGRAIYQNTIPHFHGKDHCPNEFETSYAPERPEIVYCESCYLAEVA